MVANGDADLTVADLVLPEWSGTNAKGRETRELILRTAFRVLVEEGYGAMSMRRVAADAGVKFGNLTYHYPSRDDLFTELLDSVIKAYEQAFDAQTEANSIDAERRIRIYVKLAFVSMQDPNQAGFAPEIWALSNHEPFAAARMNDMYARARSLLESAVRELRPDLDEHYVQSVATFAVASLEGFVLFSGAGKPFAAWHSAMERMAEHQIVSLVKTIDASVVGELPRL
jgi:AcrR family transcriptional regulator